MGYWGEVEVGIRWFRGFRSAVRLIYIRTGR